MNKDSYTSQSSSTPPFNAGLAKRLGEAADGLRDNKFYYFISRTEFPFDLRQTEGHDTPEDADNEAESLLAQLASDYKKFGPYQTPSDGSPSLDYDCLELRFMKNGNVVDTQTMDKDVDAIVLSLSAYHKFFEPYYTRLYGSDVTAEMTQAAETALASPPYTPVRHSGRTIYKAKDFEV